MHESGTRSVWMDNAPLDPGTLDRSCPADVCVVGAGIAGLCVAHELSRRGYRVAVLEGGVVGYGETSRTTAHLVTALDERFFEIERLHGAEAAASAGRAHRAAVDRTERIVEEEGIDCDFARVYGVLVVSDDKIDRTEELLSREFNAATKAGIAVRRASATPLVEPNHRPCLIFPGQVQLHPLNYLRGLVRAIGRNHGAVFTHTRVVSVRGGRTARVETDIGLTVEAPAVVVATNVPINSRVRVPAVQTAYRTYVISLKVRPGSAPAVLLWDGYWDDDLPYHYVRIARGQLGEECDYLVVGGEDHRVGQADDAPERYRRLEEWARKHFAFAGEVVHRWSGQIMEPHDEFGLIGRNPLDAENVYIVTGDSGNGMTYAGIAAVLIPDLIEGKHNEWTKMFDPARITARSAPEFFKENMHNFAQYKDWVAPVKHDISAGHGEVVRRHGKPIAVYHAPDGSMVECSAVCPHLKGVVRWNSCEHSWDCPVHGSRFDCGGKLIHGPANRDLHPEEPERDHGVDKKDEIRSTEEAEALAAAAMPRVVPLLGPGTVMP